MEKMITEKCVVEGNVILGYKPNPYDNSTAYSATDIINMPKDKAVYIINHIMSHLNMYEKDHSNSYSRFVTRRNPHC